MNIIVSRANGNILFVWSNLMHESTYFVITPNRSLAEWAGTLNDEVLATAILAPSLYKCELTQLSGNSCRIANRKTIFKKTRLVNISFTDTVELKTLFCKSNCNIVNELNDSSEPTLFNY